MRKERVNYELKRIDNFIVLTIGSVEKHSYSKLYFSIEFGKEASLMIDIYQAMLEYESEREKIIVNKENCFKELFKLTVEGVY